MSESQLEILQRIKAEAMEARKHNCEKCGHEPGTHAFDVYPMNDSSTCPCAYSCTVCFDIQSKELKKK